MDSGFVTLGEPIGQKFDRYPNVARWIQTMKSLPNWGKVHFWLYNIALPIQMGTLAMFASGNTTVEPALALASIVIGIGFLCFAINLWKHTGR